VCSPTHPQSSGHPGIGICVSSSQPCPLTPLPALPCLLQDGNVVAVDPCLSEEASQAGGLTLVMNPHKEVCAVHKADGVGISADQLMRWGQGRG
jgi:exosome complex component RRP45